MRHDTDAVSRHLDRKTTTSSVHLESAFLIRVPEPSASSEFRTGKALSIIYMPTEPRDLEQSGIKRFVATGEEMSMSLADAGGAPVVD
jgi:hypothetical protein